MATKTIARAAGKVAAKKIAAKKVEPKVVRESAQRSMWSGAITFGMVVIPVKMYVATDSKDVHFNLVCREHNSKITMPRMCVVGEHKCDPKDLVKGYDLGNGKMVTFEDAELDDLPVQSLKTIAVERFVRRGAVLDPINIKTVYYLAPDKLDRPYALIRDVLAQTDQVGVGKIALRGGRERLCALSSEDGVVRLNVLFWPDEVRDPEQIRCIDASYTADEFKVAKEFVTASMDEFRPAEYRDNYREAIVAKIEGRAPIGVAAPVVKPLSLMDALKASVASAKERKR